MEIWFTIILSVSAALFLHAIFSLRRPSSASLSLPPGPDWFPIIGTIRWLRVGLGGLESFIRSLHRRFGPVVTLYITSRPAIFVADRSLAYQALIQNGAVFADRPPGAPTSKIVSSNQHNISSASYGATWRLLRRNLTSEILHPSRVRSFSHARRWVLQILSDRFRTESKGGEAAVRVVDHLHYSMFALLVLMCFGDKLDEKQIKQVEFVQRRMLLTFTRFNILNLWPKLTKIVLRRRWEEFFRLRREQEDVLLPLIHARKKIIEQKGKSTAVNDTDYVLSYVDTLLDLELPEEEEKRKLTEEEMVTLCSEFLNAGTDTTATALQWIMANLVKYPEIQERLYEEIKGVIGENKIETEEVGEDDLQKMPYLKAVILEGLRRHPPGHLVLPHSVTKDTVLGGYRVPRYGTINFMVAEMGWDPEVWKEPMAFKPERFMEEQIDITGSRGIKMMPFGAGRRICPGLALALLHLEYYVANLVWQFQWKSSTGDGDGDGDGGSVDLSEKLEFTVVMKHPLMAYAIPRREVGLRA